MTDEDIERLAHWDARKSVLMAELLGEEHKIVMHAIVPYAVGGPLDLYYYPNGLPGTAIATKELSELPSEGSTNSAYECYELVMFTKLRLDIDSALNENTRFGRTHSAISSILNRIARYSEGATLEPGETCEIPADDAQTGSRCLIFDGYPSYSNERRAPFGLLAIIEVHRSEMEYAQRYGGAELLRLLKSTGYYPYSDLDREPIA